MSIGAAHGIAVVAMFFIATIFSVGFAALLFTPYILWRHGIRWPGLSGLWRYGLLSLLSTIFFWSMFEGLRYTDSLNTSAISTTIPGFTAIYGAILMRERLGRYRFAALLLGLLGTLWVIFRGDPDRLIALELNKGDALFFAGCISMGLYAALIPKLHCGEPVAVMSFWIMVIVTAMFIAVANVEFVHVAWGRIDGSVWGSLVWLAIGPTMLTFFMIQSTSLMIGATRVQSYSYLIPAFVLVFDWALGRGLPTAMTIPGVVIVLLATLVIQRGVLVEAGEPTNAKD